MKIKSDLRVIRVRMRGLGEVLIVTGIGEQGQCGVAMTTMT